MFNFHVASTLHRSLRLFNRCSSNEIRSHRIIRRLDVDRRSPNRYSIVLPHPWLVFLATGLPPVQYRGAVLDPQIALVGSAIFLTLGIVLVAWAVVGKLKSQRECKKANQYGSCPRKTVSEYGGSS